MINKVILILIALILLALAGEGGYILGVNAGKKIGVQEILKKLIRQEKTEKPAAVIPILDKSVIKWVEYVSTLPTLAIWNSNWQVIIGGKFISMNDKAIILEINGENKMIDFPVEMSKFQKVQFSQYNIETKTYTPNSLNKDEIIPGDTISMNITISTLTGKASFLDISKQVGQQIF